MGNETYSLTSRAHPSLALHGCFIATFALGHLCPAPEPSVTLLCLIFHSFPVAPHRAVARNTSQFSTICALHYRAACACLQLANEAVK